MSDDQGKRITKLSVILPPIALILLFCAGITWSWRKWPDILIDFGRELYIPWQISSGQILYKDLAHLFGPFSAYFNAFLFSVFGASYTVLIVTNISLLALFLGILYVLLVRVGSRWAAFVSCAVIISIFAFSQYVIGGNFNFISPYSHEATHGVILSLLMICLFYRFFIKRAKYSIAFAGFVLGLIFLTKIEVFFSASVTASFFFVLVGRDVKSFTAAAKSMGTFFVGALVPVIGFLAYFCSNMPAAEAARAVLSSSGISLTGSIIHNPFYARSMGLDDISANLGKMFFHTFVAVSALTVIAALSCWYAKYKSRIAVRCFCVIGLAATVGAAFYINPFSAGRSLPLLSAATFLILLISYLRSSAKNREESYYLVPLLLWCIFSMVLLSKVILNSRLFTYGFYLAMPSVVLLIVALVWLVPKWIDRTLAGGRIFRNVITMVIIVIAAQCYLTSNAIYRMKSIPVGSGADRFLAFHPAVDQRTYSTVQALEWLGSNVGPKETIVVLPEGVMLNYLTKRTNPTRYTNFMIPEMLTFREDVILKDFMGHSPDYFVLVHKDTGVYGVRYFGQDPGYGKEIMMWVNENYEPVRLFGSEPFTGERFGIKIMKRRVQ